MEKYNVKVGDIVKQFGKSANGTTKIVLTRITAIHPKGSPEYLSTWGKEGWTNEGVKSIKRFKDGAAAIEFEIVNDNQIAPQQKQQAQQVYSQDITDEFIENNLKEREYQSAAQGWYILQLPNYLDNNLIDI